MLAGRTAETEPLLLLSEAQDLLSGVPDRVSPIEEVLTRSLVAQVVGAVLRSGDLEERPDLARSVLLVAAGNSHIADLRNHFSDLLGRCAALLGHHGGNSHSRRRQDPRVARTLELLATRYNDPHLRLQSVAQEVRLSPSHLERLLKRQTGRALFAHLHQARIAAAQRFLRETTLSIKEIATAVGYENTRQLDRHFKHVCSLTPTRFRNS